MKAWINTFINDYRWNKGSIVNLVWNYRIYTFKKERYDFLEGKVVSAKSRRFFKRTIVIVVTCIHFEINLDKRNSTLLPLVGPKGGMQC